MTLLTVVVLRERALWVRRIVHRRQAYTGSKTQHDQKFEGCKCKCGIKFDANPSLYTDGKAKRRKGL